MPIGASAAPWETRKGVIDEIREAVAAARRAGAEFKSVITAEEAGYYKPRPEPYRALIAALGTLPERTLFVAGSAADVPGARQAGMPVYWHNRIGRPAIAGAVPDFEERSLERLVDIVTGSE